MMAQMIIELEVIFWMIFKSHILNLSYLTVLFSYKTAKLLKTMKISLVGHF